MEKKLNHLLADLVVEYHKMQNFHWYVQGNDFFTVHAKLEEYYDEILEMIDEVAEKILMRGGRPLGCLRGILQETSIREAEGQFISSATALQEVKRDLGSLAEDVRGIKKEADDAGDYMISALMDDYIAHFAKSLWMIGQWGA